MIKELEVLLRSNFRCGRMLYSLVDIPAGHRCMSAARCCSG